MTRLGSFLGSLLFLAIAPGTVAFAIPRWIHQRATATQPWEFVTAFPLRAAGGLLIVAGLCVLLDSFARFAIEGLGTPAPVAPTKNLVVTGSYRHVRNPMYVAVTALILGQGLVWADARVIEYGAAVWLASHLFVTIYEEPTLERTFPHEYADFRLNVPRWIPRIRAWRQANPAGPASDSGVDEGSL